MYVFCFIFFFFFSSRRRHTRFDCDWSSDVCSSDLLQKRWNACAVLLGLSVHWKIYPIIYMSSLIPLVDAEFDSQSTGIQYLLKWRSEERRVGKECRYRWWRER